MSSRLASLLGIALALAIFTVAAYPASARADYDPGTPPSPNIFFSHQFFETPGPLFGESLGGFLDELQLIGSCVPKGNSTFTFQARGSAFGPYVGRFVETGTYTIGPVEKPVDGSFMHVPTQEFETDFTIVPEASDPNPAFERVVGHMSMLPETATGYCTDEAPLIGTVRTAAARFRYEADVYVAGQVAIHDSGESSIEVTFQQLLCDKDKDHVEDSKDKCEFKVLNP
jgi:hypothetical protein